MRLTRLFKSTSLLAAALILSFAAGSLALAAGSPRVKLETPKGDIVIELYPNKAPRTVANFLQYVRDGFYDGTIFHRVINGVIIQGGGLTPDMEVKETRGPIRNEANNRLRNDKYTVAMARTSNPHSATAQFFINVKDNNLLNYKASNEKDYGYCVFGKVVMGQDIVDRIAKVPTTYKAGRKDVPRDPVVIREAVVLP